MKLGHLYLVWLKRCYPNDPTGIRYVGWSTTKWGVKGRRKIVMRAVNWMQRHTPEEIAAAKTLGSIHHGIIVALEAGEEVMFQDLGLCEKSAEKTLIAAYRAAGIPLWNILSGGDDELISSSLPPKTKAKRIAAWRMTIDLPEMRAKMSAAAQTSNAAKQGLTVEQLAARDDAIYALYQEGLKRQDIADQICVTYDQVKCAIKRVKHRK